MYFFTTITNKSILSSSAFRTNLIEVGKAHTTFTDSKQSHKEALLLLKPFEVLQAINTSLQSLRKSLQTKTELVT